jgi:hypothetical protein
VPTAEENSNSGQEGKSESEHESQLLARLALQVVDCKTLPGFGYTKVARTCEIGCSYSITENVLTACPAVLGCRGATNQCHPIRSSQHTLRSLFQYIASGIRPESRGLQAGHDSVHQVAFLASFARPNWNSVTQVGFTGRAPGGSWRDWCALFLSIV